MRLLRLVFILFVLMSALLTSAQTYAERNPQVPRTSPEHCPQMPVSWVDVTEQWLENRLAYMADPFITKYDLPFPQLTDYRYLKGTVSIDGVWYALIAPYNEIDSVLIYAGWYIGDDLEPHPACGVWIKYLTDI